jgi:hypothetical protein
MQSSLLAGIDGGKFERAIKKWMESVILWRSSEGILGDDIEIPASKSITEQLGAVSSFHFLVRWKSEKEQHTEGEE